MAETVADYPHLLALWDSERNSETPADVPARNYRTAWWRCRRGHSFQRQPRMMLRDATCPTCGVTSTSFAVEYLHLARLWHPTRNGDLGPDMIDGRHAAEVWWACERGHAFRRAPLQMPHDSSCPTCALAEVSVAACFPTIALEWHPVRNGDITPDQVDADHQMNAWWRCDKSHEFQATVRSRCRGSRRCPICYGAWSVEHLRTFVKALLAHVDALNPSEMFALAMQAGALRNASSKAFVMALTTGRFPQQELEKFAEGKPSLVDEFAADRELTLEIVDARQAPASLPPTEFYTLPAAPATAAHDKSVDVDVDLSQEVDLTTRTDAEGNDLPIVQARDALAALDNILVATADAETVKFLLDSAKAKLWRHAYVDAAEARQQAAGFKGDVFSSRVRDDFLGELDVAEALEMPKGYAFRPTKKHPITRPHLMQQHVAVSVRSARRYGNWSGMGAGKTLSAVLATRVVDAGLTVICCPNAVVENWESEVRNAFPQCEVATKTWTPEWKDPLVDAPRYLVMNFEQFQQPKSEEKLVTFLERNVVDFVVIDEIHYAKQREPGAAMSQRKKLVQALVLESGKKNGDLCVLGMSGTPVINTLQEGKSLVEMITGHRHDDIETRATVQNCMRLYQRLVTLGTRWKPNYRMQLDESGRPEIDCAPHLEEIRRVGRGSVLDLEQVLTRVRLPVILQHLKHGEKAIVYTHYVDGIASELREAIADAGFRVGFCTGDDDSGLEEFKKADGRVDVLVASSRIGTGVDGLQHVCNKLIINALPWTNAEYEQLRGRLWRQGSVFDKITVIIPVTYAVVNGERWSYCESKLQRLEYKKSIADAAVDGIVPEGNLRTPAQAQQDIMNWLNRLDTGDVAEVVRPAIKIPLSGEPSEVKRRVSTYGDFGKVNNRWYAASSATTHARLAANPEEWAHYHTMYRELRESWPVVPFKEEIRWLSQRDGMIVGDFGCGEGLLGQAVGDRHKVHSFDHVSLGGDVVACDMASVPLEDGTLDLAIFCLSLMGANFTDYIREAHRCLRLDGMLHVWEAATYFEDAAAFCAGLARLGFDVHAPSTEGAFVRIRAVKNTTVPPVDLALPFRGRT